MKFPDNSLTLKNFKFPWHFPDAYVPWRGSNSIPFILGDLLNEGKKWNSKELLYVHLFLSQWVTATDKFGYKFLAACQYGITTFGLQVDHCTEFWYCKWCLSRVATYHSLQNFLTFPWFFLDILRFSIPSQCSAEAAFLRHCPIKFWKWRSQNCPRGTSGAHWFWPVAGLWVRWLCGKFPCQK